MKENFLFFEKRKKKHSNIRYRHRISRRDRTETTLKKNEKKNNKTRREKSLNPSKLRRWSTVPSFPPPPSLFSIAYVVSKASPCLSMLFFFRVRSFADNVQTRTSPPSPLGLPVVSTVREERTHQTALYTFWCFGLIDRKGTRSSVQKKKLRKRKENKKNHLSTTKLYTILRRQFDVYFISIYLYLLFVHLSNSGWWWWHTGTCYWHICILTPDVTSSFHFFYSKLSVTAGLKKSKQK